MNDDDSRLRRVQPVIRVFVSSTFSDLKHERDALQRHVFPSLERFCARRNFQFQAIDLRWGISAEAGRDHRSMRICFSELERSQTISPQPNFVILLGDRYGWRPLPEELSQSEFERIEVSAARLGVLTTFNEWYRRDNNAEVPTWILQSRLARFGDGVEYDNPENWRPVEKQLWGVLTDAYPDHEFARRFDIAAPARSIPSSVKCRASATEQEIWRGALQAEHAEQHVIAFFRAISALTTFAEEPGASAFVDLTDDRRVDIEAQQALRALKSAIKATLAKRHVMVSAKPVRMFRTKLDSAALEISTDHLAPMCEAVQRCLEEIITRQIDQFWTTRDLTVPPSRLLQLEKNAHRRFGLDRAPAGQFVGRDRHLQLIASYLVGDSRDTLVILGASGSGKTALMARAAQEHETPWQPIVRFIGATPRSAALRSLLVDLCAELRERNPLTDPLPTELDELTREFHLQLSNDSAERPLVLFLDAVDQLGGVEGGHSLDWLPQGLLPRFVKLILSCVSDRTGGASAGNPMAVIRGWHLGDANVINLDALSREEAATLVFDRWLPQHGRRVTTEQRQLIERQLERPECRHPLYLKILFEEARLWRSYDAIAVLGQDVPGLLKTLFDRLEQPVNHGSMVSCTMAYLAASRRGLAENEILELLFRDEEYRASLGAETLQPLPLGATRIPIAVWSRLRHNLATYVSEHAAPGATVLNFYHLAVAEYARERFLHDTQRTHARLAAYFDTMSNFLDATGDALANARKSDELLWHAIHGGEWDLADRLYGTTDFLEASIRSGLLDGLVSDSDAALSRRPSARIEMVRNALLGAVPALRARPEYALQTLRNAFAFASPREEATPLADAAEARLDDRGLWLAAETPSPDGRPGDAGMWELGGRGAQTVSAAEGVLHVGTPKGAVESRDLQTGRVLGIRQLGTLPVLVLARNRRGRFAWIDSKAIVRVERSPFKAQGRPWQDAYVGHGERAHDELAFLGDSGLVFARSDNTVVLWDPATGDGTVLLSGVDMGKPARVVSSGDGTRIVVIVSTGGPARVLDLRTEGGGWTMREIENLPAPVCVAAVSPDGRCILLALQNRTLLLFAANAPEPLRVKYDDVSPLKGIAAGCALPDGEPDRALIADGVGLIGLWDVKRGSIRVVGRYGSVREQEQLFGLAFVPRTERYVATTHRIVRIASWNAPALLPPRPPVPVSACALGAAGWAAIASEIGGYVQWLRGAEPLPVATGYAPGNPYHPTCLAFTDANGTLAAGDLSGAVWRQRPGRRATPHELNRDFESPVASIFATLDGRAVAAARAGLIWVYDFDAGTARPIIAGFLDDNLRRIVRLNEREDFVCWGEHKAGAAGSWVAVVGPGGRREMIHAGHHVIRDIAVAPETVAVATEHAVLLYKRSASSWHVVSSRSKEVGHLGFCGADRLAVVSTSEPWIELWSVQDGLKTAAAAKAPNNPSAMAADPGRILIGAANGAFQLFSVRNGGGAG